MSKRYTARDGVQNKGKDEYDHQPVSPGKRSRETTPGSYFGRKVLKEDKYQQRDAEAVLDYGQLYPSQNESKSSNVNSSNPKYKVDETRREVLHSDDEFEYKIKHDFSESDDENSMRDSKGYKSVSIQAQNRKRDNEVKGSASKRTSRSSPIPEAAKINAKTEHRVRSMPSKSYAGSQECAPIDQGFPSVLTAYKSGIDADHIQCVIVRDRTGFQAKIFPNYELRLQSTNKVLILAKKMNMNRTSNYHLFDMTRGTVGRTLSKKSGNYIGKLRSKNAQRTEYIVLNHASERQEVGGFMFDRSVSPADTSEGGIKPRKLSVILPRLTGEGQTVPNQISDDVADDCDSSIMEILRETSSSDRHGMYMLETKEPAFVNGFYRLNFNGRVSVPSVKNFQLVDEDDSETVVCQFGKVDSDRFHLDFKTPFNAFQAFALSLAQFDL